MSNPVKLARAVVARADARPRTISQTRDAALDPERLQLARAVLEQHATIDRLRNALQAGVAIVDVLAESTADPELAEDAARFSELVASL